MEQKEIKTEWDLNPLLKGGSFEEKREKWRKTTDDFISKWKNRTDYLENPEILKEALDEYEKWKRDYGTEADEFYYYWLKSSLNQEDPEIKARLNKIEEFRKKIDNNMSFFLIKLSKVPEEKQNEFLNSDLLNQYKHFLETLFRYSKYLLSEEEEKILNLKSLSSYELWVNMVSEFISKEEREVLNEKEEYEKKNFSDLLGLITNKNKKIRDKAAEAFNDILKNNINSAEAEINAVLLDKKIDDELRGFKRADESRHIEDDIESEVVDSLVESVSSNFNIAKDYYELKAKLLGVKKLAYHERTLEYGSIDKEYSYEDSIALIYKVFKNLDDGFAEFFKRFVNNGNIDVFPRKGKTGGAFCAYRLKTQPTYILLNHTNKLSDVETIAHEVGHGINDELMKEKQNSLNFYTPTSTAEVASTFMEDFVLEELMKNADEEMRLALMMEKLDRDISTIFRQIAFYNFERELHKELREKGYLSKEKIGEIFRKHMESYMGEYVEQSEGNENWWSYVPHFRMFFYVYSYSSGLIISKALQRKVKDNPLFIEKFKEFLSMGGSKSPREIFYDMGIDISKREFWLEGINEVENLLNDTRELAKKLGKI